MNHTFSGRLLAVLLAVLCLIPAAAGAMPDITSADSSAYSWNETKKLLTVTGDNVVVETSVANAEFDINVESGSLIVNGHVIGDVTVTGGTLSIIQKDWAAARAATLTGGLSVEGGEVYIEGLTIYGGHGSTEGVHLTKNSAITGGRVMISGGNDMDGGSPALTREADVTLSVSGEAWLRLASGVTILDDPNKSFPPDYTKPSAVLDEADLDMLIWGSPAQMMTGNYDGSANKFKDWATVYKPGDMKGKSVIESFKGWVVSYDANGGTGSMDGAIVADGQPYTIETECGFTPPEGYSFAGSWLVNDEPARELTFPVTEDTTIKPVWKADTISLQLAFVDENGAEISGWAYAYLDGRAVDNGTPTTFDQLAAGEYVITEFAELLGYKTPDDVVICMNSNGTIDSRSDHAVVTKNANGTWIITVTLKKETFKLSVQLAFVDENGAEISDWVYAYLDETLVRNENPTAFDQLAAGECVITDFRGLQGYKTPDDVIIWVYEGSIDSLSDHASVAQDEHGTWIVTIRLISDTGSAGGGYAPGGGAEEERFTVTFMDGDKLWTETGVSSGVTLGIVGMPVPSAPEGYAFAGWYTQDGIHVKHGMVVDRDMIAYAKWQPFSEKVVTVYTGDSIVMTVDAPEADYYEWAVDYGDGKGWHKMDNDAASYTTAPTTLSNSGYRYRCIAKKLGNALPQSCIFTLKVIDRNALPQTGDPSSLLGWLMLLGASGVGAKALQRRKK